MNQFGRTAVLAAAFAGLFTIVQAQPATQKPVPDSRFGNWLYKAPDPKVWKRTEQNGAVVFSVDEPPDDFCTLTLFPGATAGADFTQQFSAAVDADQKAKGTVSVEADTGAKASKAAEGFDVLTRNMRSVTSALHTFHMYVGGHSGDRFDLAAFQTTSEQSWNQYGAQASQFLLSLKLANSLPADEVAKLTGAAAANAVPPPSLPGFGDAGPAAAPTTPATPTPAAAPAVNPVAQAPSNIPDRPVDQSPLVINHSVIDKKGKPIDGVKLSQHDTEVLTPSMAVGADGVIHVAFVEKHKTTYAYAVYYRSSSDGGKTWTEAKNMSEEMPGLNVGRCVLLVDGKNRVYVIWRVGLREYYPVPVTRVSGSCSDLVYRVLDGGSWSKILPLHPPASATTQDDGSLSYFAVVDPAGRAQVVWNAAPDKWHPELTKTSGTYHQHLPGVGNGLVFQDTIDGATVRGPREVFLTPVGGLGEGGGYGTYCDGLDTLDGYVDSSGAPHFVAAVTSNHAPTSGKSVFRLIEDGKEGETWTFPDLSYHGYSDIPTLLIDAAGKRHVIALWYGGERPNVRDYVVGTDNEPTVIRAAAQVKGSVEGFQACQGPGGRMVVIMQMNDSGERGSGDTFVSESTGKGWSAPVNVTNNDGRRSFASKQTSSQSNVAVEKSYSPGPATAAYDRDGHLLLLMVNNEIGLFASTAFGVELAGGSSSTPTLQFLRF